MIEPDRARLHEVAVAPTVVATGPVSDPDAAPNAAPSGSTLPERTRGSVLGRYVVLNRLGVGGMGVVYAAFDPELDRKVAIKLLQHRDKGSMGPARLLREAQAMARLSHPGVITVHDVGIVDDQVFIAMELVEGGTLREWLNTQRHWREIVAVFIQAGEGLAAAHNAGLVHRDFKPDNVLIGDDGAGLSEWASRGVIRGFWRHRSRIDPIATQFWEITPARRQPGYASRRGNAAALRLASIQMGDGFRFGS